MSSREANRSLQSESTLEKWREKEVYQYNLRMCFEVSISFEEEYIKTIQRETNSFVRSRTQFYSLKFKERNLLLSRSKCYIKSRCPRKENNIFYLGAKGLV